jgi:polysaccharide biosynthesis/export protein
MDRTRNWFAGALLCVALAGPGPAAAQDGTAAVGAARKDYRIGVEDVLSVQIWESKDLDQVVTVRPDGKISLQLLGDIEAAGSTVAELRMVLQDLYQTVIEDVRVAVNVQEIRSRAAYFVGEVGKAGPLPLTRKMTLLQAVAMVGGFTKEADLETAYVLREERVIRIDFRELMRNPDPSRNIEVLPGDAIVVPPGESVYIQGEVKSPGLLKCTRDLTVLKAIAEAGGLTDLARGSRIYLLRGRGESKVRIEVDVDAMLSRPEDVRDLPLEAGDILTVPQRLF